MHDRVLGGLLLVGALALTTPSLSVAEGVTDAAFDAVLVPTGGEDYNCYYRPTGDPAPWPDIIVSPGTGVPDITTALGAVANNPLADANADGVISICVEPGTYAGGHLINMSAMEAPLWLWSSDGASVTTIAGTHEEALFGRAIGVFEGLSPPTLSSQWKEHFVVRGFTIDGFVIGTGTDPEGGAALLVSAAGSASGFRAKMGACRITNVASGASGGAVSSYDSWLRLYAVEVEGASSSTRGGVLHSEDSDVELWRVDASDAVASREGGVFDIVGSNSNYLNVQDSSFALAGVSPGGDGGGCGNVESLSLVEIYRSTFSFCESAAGGGGLRSEDLDRIDIVESSFRDCSAVSDGGAMLLSDELARTTTTAVNLLGLVAEKSTADRGGGLFLRSRDQKAVIAGSSLSENFAVSEGGGIYSSSGDLLLTASSVEQNSVSASLAIAGSGGGLWIEPVVLSPSPQVEINASTFASNTAAVGGSIGCGEVGGVGAQIDVVDSTIRDSSAVLGGAGGAGQGGGLFARECNVSLEDSTFRDNCANQQGAGVYVDDGDLVVAGGHIEGNGGLPPSRTCPSQPTEGGGIYWDNVGSSAATFHVDGLVLMENEAALRGGGARAVCDGAANTQLGFDTVTASGNLSGDSGGALHFSDCDAQIDGGSWNLNNAVNNGGAIYGSCPSAAVGQIELNQALLENNSASDGGGLSSLWCSTSMDQSILADNYASGRGGAVHIVGEPRVVWAPSQATEFALSGVVMRENSAGLLGGAVHGSEVFLHQSGGGGYDGNFAVGGGGGAMVLNPPAAVILSEIAFHDNEAFGLNAGSPGNGGAAIIAASEATLTNVLVAENVQADGAALEMAAWSPFAQGGAQFDLSYVTIAGNYGSSAPLNGLSFGAVGTAVASGTVANSMLGMNQGTLQMNEPAGILTEDTLFYSHGSPTATIGALMNGDVYAQANGCQPINPGLVGGWNPLVSAYEGSQSNQDPWDTGYSWYSYEADPIGPLAGSDGSGSEGGAFGGPGGSWCQGLTMDTCIP